MHTNFLINLYKYGIENYNDESLIYNLIYLSNYLYNSDDLKLIPGDSQSFVIDLHYHHVAHG